MNKDNLQRWISQRKDWIIVFALTLIGITMIYQGLEKQKKKIGLDAAVVEVLIAGRTIEKGEPFRGQDLIIEIMPEKYVPIGALYPNDAAKFSGQVLSRTVNKGEIILSNALDIDFSLDNASGKIQEGYRALTIPVDAVSSLSQSLEPGDHIDLLTSLPVRNDERTTMTLLQNVTVLATGSLHQNEDHYGTITLMVLPEEAPLIIHTLQDGDISIILRNPYDQDTKTDLPMVTKNEIIAAGFLNHVQSTRDQKIRILRGNEHSGLQ